VGGDKKMTENSQKTQKPKGGRPKKPKLESTSSLLDLMI
jgi:hypothetical protein